MAPQFRPLILHPDCAGGGAVTAIEVEATRPEPALLSLRYRLAGGIDAIRLPPPGEPARAGRLWEHSCFEAFVRGPAGEAYYELNFAPSREWAAYRFEGYRRGMAAALAPALEITCKAGSATFELHVRVGLEELHDLPPDMPWRMGLSAVIEGTYGTKSYWALAHPPGKPDFHHDHCFALELPPAIG